MKNTKLFLSALAIGSIAVACNNPPAATDAGSDAGMTPDGGHDAGSMLDTGVDAFTPPVDANSVPLDCTGYCTQITTACTAGDAQYADMATCMTACTAAGWTVGTEADTTGNTLGCRIYHALASMADPTTHCAHAGLLSAGSFCTPFRTDAPVESTTTTGYVRVDRMGMPAVATALIGPGRAATANADKDDYNDSNPTGDSGFASGIPLLTAIGFYHAALDTQLVAAHLEPCSVAHSFPVPGAPAPIPACGVQHYDGTDLTSASPATVASLILPDTLTINTAGATHFPNGRAPGDPVIDPILSALLLNLSLCAGTRTGAECSSLTVAACPGDANCMVAGTSCVPVATSSVGVCGAQTTSVMCAPHTDCTWTGTACVPVPCEAIPATATAAACPLFAGCHESLCGTGTSAARCTVGTLSSIPLNPSANDATVDLTTFPYFAAPH